MKISKNGLGTLVGMGLIALSFGPIIGAESNIKPFYNDRINEPTFKDYLNLGKKEMGNNIGTYLFALWTYPGVELGISMHNFGLKE